MTSAHLAELSCYAARLWVPFSSLPVSGACYWSVELGARVLGPGLAMLTSICPFQLLGLLLSICLCRHIHSEDYSKVPKY